MTDLEKIKQMAKLELANREFFYFFHFLATEFYAADRQYLIDLCNEMQVFYESDDDVLIVNVPPRHGKSRTAVMLAQWIFGQNQNENKC